MREECHSASEVMSWFLAHSGGKVWCVSPTTGAAKEIDNYAEAVKFFEEEV